MSRNAARAPATRSPHGSAWRERAADRRFSAFVRAPSLTASPLSRRRSSAAGAADARCASSAATRGAFHHSGTFTLATDVHLMDDGLGDADAVDTAMAKARRLAGVHRGYTRKPKTAETTTTPKRPKTRD
jgi:hypothetical protein